MGDDARTATAGTSVAGASITGTSIESEIAASARRLLGLCRKHGVKVTAAESCTGGLVCAALTDIAGASDAFDRGFITYSKEAKHQLLGAPTATLAQFGA